MRGAVPFADLLLVPHAAVLHRSTRESLGLDVRSAVVILDEAHNIVEALQSAHEAKVRRHINSRTITAPFRLISYIQGHSGEDLDIFSSF